MKRELYDRLCAELTSMDALQQLAQRLRSEASYDTLVSIYSNVAEARIKAADRAMKDGIGRWLEEVREL
jgi:hypothetical protein